MAETDKIVKDSESKMKLAEEAVKKQFQTIHTGRAHPSMVEAVKIDYYGTITPLKQLANITVPEARIIVIQPWDKGAINAIEKGLSTSDIGITPTNDGRVIRLSLPQLTQERREEIKKVLHRIAEEGRISIRNVRHQALEKVTQMEKDHVISEDEKFSSKDKIQGLTDKYVKMIDDILKHKEEEISK
ncbi:ribosome recycling factor [Candidatus Omnitrophus magneticus]|uniref:Ribosome-recycling factor n=1 Tax=Candidatus Omnitrophus magneticus TaxID=1609969 RepID=A0A0F0CRD7_9BACT|nr:ribosome recycling factor [Candidatus Omnitrophus magneticus]